MLGTNMSSQNNNARIEGEIELLLLEQQRNRNLLIERERDLNMCRSGSAPPTVEGAVNAIGSLFRGSSSSQLANNGSGSGSVTNGSMSEEEIRAHPAYLAYYYSNENNNPRLPPPLITREDWRVAQRVGPSFGGREEWRKNNVAEYGGSSSLFSAQPTQKADDELMLLRKAANSNSLRRSSPDLLDQSMLGTSGADIGLRRKSFADIVQENQALAGHLSLPSSRNSLSDNLATSGVSDARSSELQSRASTSEVLRPGKLVPGGLSSGQNSSLHRQFRVGVPSASLDRSRSEATNYADLINENGLVPPGINNSSHGFDGKPSLPRKAYSSTNLQSQLDPPGFGSMEEWNSYNSCNNNNNAVAGLALQSALINARMKRNAGLSEPNIHPALLDPHHVHQLLETHNQHMNTGHGLGNPSQMRNGHGLGDLHDMEMLYLETLLSQQKLQYQSPMYNSSGLHHRRHTNLGLNHMGRSFHPSVGTATAMYQNKRIPLESGTLKKSGSAGSWNPKAETNEEGSVSTLLDELKNNSRSLELSDVVGHITEFSMDQYGSRFIQEKLETATDEEKSKIFPDVTLYARSLMTDVFGNYVIQKFFQQGTESQRKELASQIMGHVLPLSLQMYGSRVIQKALEMVDVEQKTQMVQELDGSVMKCVRDQNGNHVIQKCIEFVPPDRIQFIISSFFGQVVSLSMHPYGCRVIQRVLENCNDPEAQNLIMDEIMQSICSLAQDQYGNYVIQHVLQHGKPHERSAIISKLAGQIVKMSQQKYASNVVERCLTFGSPEERQILVKEMLGSTDENEPLQEMMKDPFANYVVQKILETCDNQSHDLILSRIKVHLNSLKRYTYGKHIVSRVEKLVTTGEKHRDKQS